MKIDLDDVFTPREKTYLYAINLKCRKYENKERSFIDIAKSVIYAVYYNTICRFIDPVGYKEYQLIRAVYKGRRENQNKIE